MDARFARIFFLSLIPLISQIFLSATGLYFADGCSLCSHPLYLADLADPTDLLSATGLYFADGCSLCSHPLSLADPADLADLLSATGLYFVDECFKIHHS